MGDDRHGRLWPDRGRHLLRQRPGLREAAGADVEPTRDDAALFDFAKMVESLKALKELADKAGDNATDGMLDDWTDMAEQRVWFLKATLE